MCIIMCKIVIVSNILFNFIECFSVFEYVFGNVCCLCL